MPRKRQAKPKSCKELLITPGAPSRSRSLGAPDPRRCPAPPAPNRRRAECDYRAAIVGRHGTWIGDFTVRGLQPVKSRLMKSEKWDDKGETHCLCVRVDEPGGNSPSSDPAARTSPTQPIHRTASTRFPPPLPPSPLPPVTCPPHRGFPHQDKRRSKNWSRGEGKFEDWGRGRRCTGCSGLSAGHVM